MSRNPIINTPPQGRTIAVVGDVYRFLATGDDTNGKYALFEALVGPGGGPPPHVHSREEEGFYVLEGEITFTINGHHSVWEHVWNLLQVGKLPTCRHHAVRRLVVNKHGLTSDPALVLLAKIVNRAATDNSLWCQPESAGLNATEWIVYDALYAYCREMVRRGKLDGAVR